MSNKKAVRNLTIIKIISALIGVLYSVSQIHIFGADRIVEVFFAAQAVVYLIMSLTQSGQLSEILLPEYIGLRENSSIETAHKAFSVVLNRLFVGFLLMAAIAFFLAPYIIYAYIPGYSEADRTLGVSIFRAFLPFICLQINFSFLRSLLNAEKIYGKIEIADVFSSVTSLLVLLVFHSYFGIWVLLIGLYIGKIVAVLVAIYHISKCKIKYYFIWEIKAFDHLRFFKKIFSTLSYTGATQVRELIYTASMSFLPEGTFAIYNYVKRLYSKVTGIFTQPLATVFFTKISDEITKGFNDSFKAINKKLITMTILFSGGVFILAHAAGSEALAFLWKNDKFGDQELNLAFILLLIFMATFIIQTASNLERKKAIALNLASPIYRTLALVQLVSGGLMFFLIEYFNVSGLFFGIAIAQILFLITPSLVIQKYKPTLETLPKFLFFIKISVIITAVVLFIYFLKNSFVIVFSDIERVNYLGVGLFWATIAGLLYLSLNFVLNKELLISIKNDFLKR